MDAAIVDTDVVSMLFKGDTSSGGRSLAAGPPPDIAPVSNNTYDLLKPYVRCYQDSVMTVTASQLRENIYRILDSVLETGVPVEVRRKGKLIRIVPEQKHSKLSRLKKRPYPLRDPQSIVHLDWLQQWSELR
jgi:antitoxin (DNA-binding transcriptional repressor) of toxin-antitoxin stability system